MQRRAFLTALPAMAFSQPALARPVKRDTFIEAAREQTQHAVTYDSAYTRIAYPMGDVAANKGVCSDVAIRAYRAIGIDLQQKVHEDMAAHFALYPKNWGLKRPDSNIDHRRVPNLEVFFKRFGTSLPTTRHASDYAPGDLVTYRLMGNLPHIAIVSDQYALLDRSRPLIIQNIGWGPKQEDSLFIMGAEISGHFRYGL
ncbi:DUF1287 domain-containing protein [Asticcacaulis benevestitus]|uniref:DUF1287 domain-containing protein n=1 Tax=Asticcacaulis benevestitus DSM 16100 = ATCC BAA-896 TaxID=1121022 RepID=V4PKY0_9CAUL|nr:DUF1287 domain-containing protein [Asticcacaulis benevestitus]ESQ94617.1 hypothetical protein ABENE_00560 [Asticcacaulis benevestitus DSM 16100 = ATCC BAA-896]